jgi:hypothetical protein
VEQPLRLGIPTIQHQPLLPSFFLFIRSDLSPSTINFFCHSIPFLFLFLPSLSHERFHPDLIGGIHHGFFNPFPPRAAARGTSISSHDLKDLKMKQLQNSSFGFALMLQVCEC